MLASDEGRQRGGGKAGHVTANAGFDYLWTPAAVGKRVLWPICCLTRKTN